MDEATRERFREELRRRLAALKAEGDLEIEPGRTDVAAVGTDDDDQALTEMSQAIASGRNRERTAQARAIVKALRRMADDPEAFGECIDCGEELPDRRLELMPWAELCTDCQAATEEKRSYGRKRVDDYR